MRPSYSSNEPGDHGLRLRRGGKRCAVAGSAAPWRGSAAQWREALRSGGEALHRGGKACAVASHRLVLLALGIGAVLALGACAGSGSGGRAATLKFTLTDQGCVPDKATVPAGPVSITITNGGTTKVTELELQDKNGIILGERENLTLGLSGAFSLDIQPGSYVLFCPSGNLTRGVLKVTGKAQPQRGPSAVLLKTAVLQYRTYVESS